MLMAGSNISDSGDKLMKVKVDYLYHRIRCPKPEIATIVRLLRTIRDIDSNRYSHAKKQLPYFVCGTFQPPILRLENFAYIKHFVIEINNLDIQSVDIEEIKQKLSSCKNVTMIFVSPSEISLKILFTLSQRCYDIGLFSMFYTIYVRKFMEDNKLKFNPLTATASVTQACFISVDETAYYNPNAQPIDINLYIDTNNPVALFDTMREVRHAAHELKKTLPASSDKAETKDPSKESMLHIKEILLGAKSLVKDRKPMTDSKEVDSIVEGLKKFCADHTIIMTECIPLHHARKMRFTMDGQYSEIILYKSAKGYFIVQSPVGKVSKRLNSMTAEIINAYLTT